MTLQGLARVVLDPAPGAVSARRSGAAWLMAPVQLGLRALPLFALPFFSSGLTKWEVFPFLKPERFEFGGWPELAASALYQFSNVCEFCFNIRIWGSEAPLVQWPLPFPTALAVLAGTAEIILPVLVLVGLFTRLSALGLLAMTLVIQLVFPQGLADHATWAAVLIAILLAGPGPLSLDHLAIRLMGR